jgi:hypothetical protein
VVDGGEAQEDAVFPPDGRPTRLLPPRPPPLPGRGPHQEDLRNQQQDAAVDEDSLEGGCTRGWRGKSRCDWLLQGHEFVKVVGIQYEVKPPRLCGLRLALLDDDGRLNGKIFTVKYHDMPDVLDFFVLKQNFEMAMSRNWKVGDK